MGDRPLADAAAAAYPGLDLTNWEQLKELSQKDRNLILKISGFSEQAWGARGVWLGSDLPRDEWAAAVDEALAGFGQSPRILQRTTGQAGWMRSGMTSSLAKRSRCRAASGYVRTTLSTADGIRLRRRLGECWPRSARRTRRSSTE